MKKHDEAVVAILRENPAMATDYLRTALDELDEPGGEPAFLLALRHVVEARGGMATVAERARLSGKASIARFPQRVIRHCGPWRR
ncbi:hypothetical protein ASALC70_04234 [Alcanivorax sp. ALC70]|nr:hypothetical protein ASALC70_04234 [Alcanivorax sp. ALC70]